MFGIAHAEGVDNCLYWKKSAEEEGKSTLEEERKSRFGHINSILFQLKIQSICKYFYTDCFLNVVIKL